MDKGKKVALSTAAIFGLVGLCFSVLHFFMGLFSGNLLDTKILRTIVFYPVAGIILGLVAAPVYEPESFNDPIAWQVFFSIIGGLLFAYAMQVSVFGYLLSVIISGLLGYTAKSWLEHLPFP